MRRPVGRPRDARFWGTTFGRFVGDYSARRLAAELDTTAKSVFNWVEGVSGPRPPTAEAIARLSRGAVTVDDIRAHRSEIDER